MELNGLLIFLNGNEHRKTWNLAWCYHTIPGWCGKNFKRYCKCYDIHCLQTEHSSRNRSSLNMKCRLLQRLTWKPFLQSTYTVTWFMSKFGIWGDPFAIFNPVSAFIGVFSYIIEIWTISAWNFCQNGLKILFVLMSLCLGLMQENKRNSKHTRSSGLDPEHGACWFFNSRKCEQKKMRRVVVSSNAIFPPTSIHEDCVRLPESS